MELVGQTVEGVDQKPVDKQFPAVSKIDGLDDASGLRFLSEATRAPG
jgi:hypothetical protein